ncbi:MAG: TetR/AcrR family transcriptional regulator [Caulobacterales bacterium]|jgi:AcrR family transcriptional regulator
MARRAYSSPTREAAAAARRTQVAEVAERLLRESENAAAVSMETVAAAAGVTRLTVYKQFGSRRALLEAVFDQRAAQGGLSRIPEAMVIGDPRKALDRLVEIFCSFWASEPAVGQLQRIAASDPEFGEAIDARNERRRHAIAAILNRIDGPDHARHSRDAVDLIFALTSYATYSSLKPGRSDPDVCALIKSASADALKR